MKETQNVLHRTLENLEKALTEVRILSHTDLVSECLLIKNHHVGLSLVITTFDDNIVLLNFNSQLLNF